jgi:branched-chain amino acid transport system permease protein
LHSASDPGVTLRTAKLVPALKILGVIVLVVVGLTIPSTLGNAYLLAAAVVILNYAVCATGWNFMGGFTGYISFGHAAYFGLGAYGTALLINRLEMVSFLAVAVTVVIVSLTAIPVGFAALRLRGASFVIATIAFVLIVLLVAQSWSSLTGGSSGMEAPRPFPGLLRPEHHLRFYYLYLGLLAVALLLWWLIDRSQFGMRLKAIREDEDKARALGVPTTEYKLVAFVLSAAFTAAAGGFYALWFGDLDPVFQFSILLGAYMVLMALVGGIRSLFGPLLGAVLVGFALEYFKLNYGDTQIHLTATGLLLVLVVLFMPDGVIPGVRDLMNRRLRRGETSIREQTAEELLDSQRERTEDSESDLEPTVNGARR